MGDRRAYFKEYYRVRRREKMEWQRRYNQAHRQEINDAQKRRYVERRQEIRASQREYADSVSGRLAQRFIDLYGNVCIFCGEEVSLEKLTRHHIEGDGKADQERLGRGMAGRWRSWREAVEKPDAKKWATTHRGCHTRHHRKKAAPTKRRGGDVQCPVSTKVGF